MLVKPVESPVWVLVLVELLESLLFVSEFIRKDTAVHFIGKRPVAIGQNFHFE